MAAETIIYILSLLIPYLVDLGLESYNENRLLHSGGTPSQVVATINSALTKIRNASVSAYNEALKRLNAIPSIAATGNLQNFLRQERSRLTDALNKKNTDLNNKEAFANDIANLTSLWNSRPATYRNSKAGKAELDNIKKMAEQGANSKEIEETKTNIEDSGKTQLEKWVTFATDSKDNNKNGGQYYA